MRKYFPAIFVKRRMPFHSSSSGVPIRWTTAATRIPSVVSTSSSRTDKQQQHQQTEEFVIDQEQTSSKSLHPSLSDYFTCDDLLMMKSPLVDEDQQHTSNGGGRRDRIPLLQHSYIFVSIFCSIVLAGYLKSIWPIRYVILFHLLYIIIHHSSKWLTYFFEDTHTEIILTSIGAFFHLIQIETNRMIHCDVSRQIMAGFVLSAVTAPGENPLNKALRYKMSVVREQMIKDLEESYVTTTTTTTPAIPSSSPTNTSSNNNINNNEAGISK